MPARPCRAGPMRWHRSMRLRCAAIAPRPLPSSRRARVCCRRVAIPRPSTALRRAGEYLRALDAAAMAAAGIAEVTIRSPRIALAGASAAKAPVLAAAQAALAHCLTQAGCSVQHTPRLTEALGDNTCDAVIGI